MVATREIGFAMGFLFARKGGRGGNLPMGVVRLPPPPAPAHDLARGAPFGQLDEHPADGSVLWVAAHSARHLGGAEGAFPLASTRATAGPTFSLAGALGGRGKSSVVKGSAASRQTIEPSSTASRIHFGGQREAIRSFGLVRTNRSGSGSSACRPTWTTAWTEAPIAVDPRYSAPTLPAWWMSATAQSARRARLRT